MEQTIKQQLDAINPGSVNPVVQNQQDIQKLPEVKMQKKEIFAEEIDDTGNVAFPRGQVIRESNPFVEYVSKDPKDRESVAEYLKQQNENAIKNSVPLKDLPNGQGYINENEKWITNLYTPEKLAQIKNMKPIGAAEAFGMLNKWEILPYVNGMALAEDIKVFQIMKQMKEKPNEVTPEDRAFATQFMDEMAQMQIRGMSFGGQLMYHGIRIPAYGIEFATAISSFGLGAAPKIAKTVAKEAVKKGIKEMIEGALVSTTKAVTKTATKGLIATANPVMYGRMAHGYFDRRLNDSLVVTDKGQAVFQESQESPFKTMFKVFGDTWIENSSELAGGFLFKPAKEALGQLLPKGFGVGFKKMAELQLKMPWAKAVAEFGYDGILEELGEERLGSFIREVTNIEEDGVSFDGITKALFPGWDAMALELGLITIYGGSSMAMGKLATTLSKDKSPAEVKQIITELQALPESQKEAMVRQVQAKETEEDNVKYTANIDSYRTMLEGTMSKEEADAATAVWDQGISVIAAKTGKTRSEIFGEMAPLVTKGDTGAGLFQEAISIERNDDYEIDLKFDNKKLEEVVLNNEMEGESLSKLSDKTGVSELDLIKGMFSFKNEARYLKPSDLIGYLSVPNVDSLKENGKIAIDQDTVKAITEIKEKDMYIKNKSETEDALELLGNKYKLKFDISSYGTYYLKDLDEAVIRVANHEPTPANLQQYGEPYFEMTFDKDWDKSLSDKDLKEIEIKIKQYKKQSQAGNKELFQQPTKTEGALVAMHNLSEANLAHADKIGGLAVPSLSIGKQAHPLEGFGEITLIGNTDLITPSKETKAFGADVYSPRYPQINYDSTVSSKLIKEMDAIELEIGGKGKFMSDISEIESRGIKALYDNVALKYKFLKSQGKGFEIQKKASESKYINLVPELKTILEKDMYLSHLEAAENKEFMDAYKKLQKIMYKKAYDEMIVDSTEKEAKSAADLVAGKKEFYEEKGIPRHRILRDIKDDITKQKEIGEPDFYKNRDAVEAMINEKEFQAWVDSNYSDLITGENIFTGYTSSGSRKYKEHNLENVVAELKKTVRDGEGFNYGLGSLRSTVAKEYKTLAGIKNDRDKIISKADFEKVKVETDKLFNEIIEEAGRQSSDKGFGVGDRFTEVLKDAIKHKADIKSELDQYGFKGMDIEKINLLLNTIAEMPTEYFEVKVKRAVDLNEFKGAVIPKNASMKTRDILKKNGIEAYEYEGDRAKAIAEFTDQLNKKYGNVLFQGKRGSFDPKTNIITLFKDADKSTFLHESAHAFLEFYLKHLPSELDAVFKWAKVENKPLDQLTDAEYVKLQESFATGFEMYLREGKAPNSKLADAFERFKDWLTTLYESVRAIQLSSGLKIELNADIRAFYDEMLSVPDNRVPVIDEGMTLDGVDLNALSESERVLYQEAIKTLDEIKAKKDRNIILNQSEIEAEAEALKTIDTFKSRTPIVQSVYDKVIEASSGQTVGGTVETAKEVGALTGNFVSKIFEPLSSRAGKISSKIKYGILRKHEFAVRQKTAKREAESVPFIEKYDKLKRENKEDWKMLDYALKVSDISKINEIVEKHDMGAEYKQVTKLLEEIYDDAVSTGVDMGFIIDYFPRHVEDSKKYLSYLRGGNDWTKIDEAVKAKEKDVGAVMTDSEKAQFISNLIKGNKLLIQKPDNAKQRKIFELTPEQNTFYSDSNQALINYVKAMTETIEVRRLFGKNETELDESIGVIVGEMVANKDITKEQEDEAVAVIRARFNKRGLSGIMTIFSNLNYATLMGSPTSAVTQLEDIGVNFYEAGILNTVKALVGHITKTNEVDLHDLGIESIVGDFVDLSGGSKFVETVFKFTGLSMMDRLGKGTLVNGVYSKYKQQAQEDSVELRQLLDTIFESEAESVLNDLKSGTMSQNVKFLIFNKLLDIQPVALSEMPEAYVTGGNSRIFYQMKSFTVRRLDYMVSEVRKQLSSKNKIAGITNLVRLTGFLILMGSTADFIKDLLLSREPEPEDYVINNMLKSFGIQKWTIYDARRNGLASAIMKQILPPVKLFDDVFKDAFRTIEGKRELKDLDTWSNIPLVGKFYWWWLGRGSERD